MWRQDARATQTPARSLMTGATRLSDCLLERPLESAAHHLARELSLPAHFILQLLAIEDKRFAWHPGIDPVAVVRAAFFNIATSPPRPHGASTITQQLYSGALRRTGHWSPTLRSKLRQSLWAIRRTVVCSKLEVLKEYLDSVYFGRSFYGLKMASRGYCERAPKDLSVTDSFFLAERIARPNAVFIHRIRTLLARRPIIRLMGSDPAVVHDLSTRYEQHFGCGEEISQCLERCLKRPVERTFMSSEVASSER